MIRRLRCGPSHLEKSHRPATQPPKPSVTSAWARGSIPGVFRFSSALSMRQTVLKHAAPPLAQGAFPALFSARLKPSRTTRSPMPGGGVPPPIPSEISLAHTDVLFLDELPVFQRSTLEMPRQPLEDGKVTISCSAGKITSPGSMILVSATSPCSFLNSCQFAYYLHFYRRYVSYNPREYHA